MKYFIILLFILIAYGWSNNIYRLVTKDDFEPSYKAELLRGAGIFVAPLGVFLGFITFEEEKTE